MGNSLKKRQGIVADGTQLIQSFSEQIRQLAVESNNLKRTLGKLSRNVQQYQSLELQEREQTFKHLQEVKSKIEIVETRRKQVIEIRHEIKKTMIGMEKEQKEIKQSSLEVIGIETTEKICQDNIVVEKRTQKRLQQKQTKF